LIPNYRIKTNGKNITDALRSRLLKFSITDGSQLKCDKLSIELVDDPPIEWPSKGQVFEVAIGYENVLVDVGTYATKHVSASGYPTVLKIEASSMDQNASLKSQREQSWENTTLGDIVGDIARRNGLKPAVIGELQTIPVAYELQADSDLGFLTRLGRRYDMVVKVSQGFLMVTPADKSQKASGGELPKITVSNVIRWEYSGDQTRKYTGVRAYWYDNDAAKKVYVLVDRVGVVMELEYNKLTAERACRAAEAKFREVSRQGKSMKFTVPGNYELAAERKVVLEGIRPGVDGEWVIKQVEHVIDGSGFMSNVECSVDGYKESEPDADPGTDEKE
jgi:phage protein D